MNETQGMNEEQRYLFDTFGYIVIPDVLSNETIKSLKSTLNGSTEQFPPVPQDQGPLHWDRVWRDLLDVPRITAILEEMIGNPRILESRQHQHPDGPVRPTYRLDHINVHTHVQEGFKGGMLHGGWNSVAGLFRYDGGHFYNGLTTVTFELYETFCNDGGFACIPGSHKGNIETPFNMIDLSKSIHPSIARVAAKPGDAIIFTEALTHGTLPWTAKTPRTTIFYKYSPHAITWSADFYDADDFHRYDDMDERKLALLEPPNARYARRPKLKIEAETPQSSES